ncbi:UNVERIFIED_CONTAM: hypothetical protein FKN15_001097 [Acipenser sinensis]
MAPSRLETNFIRLLSRCESMASEKRGDTEWRLEKYVSALEEMLAALKKSTSKPVPEALTDYTRKVEFLKGLLEAEKLTSNTGAGDAEMRNRRGTALDERQSATELDTVLQHHHNIQEKLAEEMLSLARNLKNNSLAAQNVIKLDNQTLTQSMRMADVNFEKLKTESERLEQHTKKSVNWLLWIMLIIVCFIFISMILFIRIFPRLR